MSDIIAEIKSLIPPPPKLRKWYEPEDKQQAEMIKAIAEAWVRGEFGQVGRHVAPAIAQRLTEAGIHVRPNTVREWLTSLRRS